MKDEVQKCCRRENIKGNNNKLAMQEEQENEGGGGGGDAPIGSAMQQRAWEGAPAGNLKEKLGEPENGSLGILKE